MGLIALWHVGSFQTRDRTHVPCNGRQVLNHSATRVVLHNPFNAFFQLHPAVLYPYAPSCAASYLLSSSVDYFAFSRLLHIWIYTVCTFKNWLLSLSKTVLRVIHVIACIRGSVLMLWNIIPSYGFCATVYSFTVDGHLSYLKLGAVTNKSVKNTYRQIFFFILIFFKFYFIFKT